MNTTPAKTLALAALLPLCASAQIVTTVLNDNFNDNNRANQDLPSSAQWFGSAGSNLSIVEVTPSSGNYALRNNPTTTTLRHAIAYFAPADSPITLGVGDTLSFSFDLTLTGASAANTAANLRLAFFEAGADRQTGDSNADRDLAGYGAFINAGTQQTSFRERISGETGPHLSSVTNVWSATFGSSATPETPFAFLQNETYRITFSMEHQVGGMELTYNVEGSNGSFTHSFLDTTVSTASFDTVALAWGNALAGSGSDNAGLIDNVLVTYTAVPEPSSFAALLGLSALAGVGLRRRRRQVA